MVSLLAGGTCPCTLVTAAAAAAVAAVGAGFVLGVALALVAAGVLLVRCCWRSAGVSPWEESCLSVELQTFRSLSRNEGRLSRPSAAL